MFKIIPIGFLISFLRDITKSKKNLNKKKKEAI